MRIGLGQQNYLYSLLQRKNSDSSLLTPDFWSKAAKLEKSYYKRILALLFNNKIQEAEMLIQNYVADKANEK